MQITIRHSGNLLEIHPPEIEAILGEELTYWYKEMDNTPRSKTAGKMTFTKKRVYAMREGRFLCLQGLLPRITSKLAELGHTIDYQDLRTRKPLVANPEHMKQFIPPTGLRAGQEEILQLIAANDMGQFEAPTGYGKTEIISLVVSMFPEARIIVCSPSISLLKDTFPRLLRITPNVSRVGGGYKDKPGQIVLTTDKSLTRLPIDTYDMLFFDEVHRAASTETSKLLAQIRNTRMYGFSATTRKRGDGADMRTEALFGPVIYEMTYEEAEGMGYVSPVKYYRVDIGEAECSIDVSTIKLTTFKKMYAYWLNTVRNRKLMQAAATVPVQLGLSSDPQIMVAVETLTQAYALKAFDPSYTVVYADRDRASWEELCRKGTIPPGEAFLDKAMREHLRKSFSSGVLRKVICTPTWSTGMNFTHLDVIVNASGATSEILNIQWAGRGSRVRSDKPFALLIDSADQWDKWAKERAAGRARIYRSKSWLPVSVGDHSDYRQESLL